MSGLFGSSSATQANTLGDLSKDVALSSPPEDSISDLCFSPVSNHLACTSWDNKVRIYEINASGNSEGKALYEHEGPAFSCHWSPVCYLLGRQDLVYANVFAGWKTSCLGRCRQSCETDGSGVGKHYHCNSSSCTRPTDSMRPLLPESTK